MTLAELEKSHSLSVEPCDVFTSMDKGSQSQHVYIDIFSVVASLLGASLAGKRGHCESVRPESGTGEEKYEVHQVPTLENRKQH